MEDQLLIVAHVNQSDIELLDIYLRLQRAQDKHLWNGGHDPC